MVAVVLATAAPAHAEKAKPVVKKPTPTATAPATATPPPDETPRADLAQELKLKGDAAFDARDFEGAAKAYEEAYAASKDPALLYNQGRAYQAMARFPEALERITKFSNEAPAALKTRVPKLDALAAQLREKVAVLVVNCNADSARLTVDKRVVAEVTRTGTFMVNAGKSRVEIASEGYLPFTRELDLRGATTTLLEAKLLSKTEAGVLVVKTTAGAADVSVDGTASGQTPSELVLMAGAHKVTLAREGFEPLTSSTVIEAGKTKELSVTLEKRAGVLEKWWFWTAAAVVVLGGTALVVAAVTEKDAPTGSLPPGTTSAPLLSF